jgi:putative transposase
MFKRYQRSEQAQILVLMEMVVNGASTRKITQITKELCKTSFSKSTVSSLCKGLDPIIQDWNHRSLYEHMYPFVLAESFLLCVETKLHEQTDVFDI